MDILLYILLSLIAGAAITYVLLKNTKSEPTFDFQSFAESNNLPITQALDNLNNKILDLEKNRSHTDATLSQQLSQLKDTNQLLFTTTDTLSKVLSNSQSQGALGEMHLKTLLESCGLVEKIDFELQVRITDESIPDCIVKLPNGKSIVIDCKSPTKVLLDYIEADEASKSDKLKKLNISIKNHIRSLSDKNYQKDVKDSSEYVLMYLPSDSLLITAIAADPALVLYANSKNVVITSPSTIIPCLRNVEMLWRQENLNKNIQEVVELNEELQTTAQAITDSLTTVGKALNKSLEAYNEGVSSIKLHLSQIDKLKNLGK